MNYLYIGKLIDVMPTKIAKIISKFVVNRYLNKFANLSINGFENIEKLDEPVLFISNHLSNADGLVLAKVLKVVDPTFVSGVKLSSDIVTKIGLNVVKTTNIKPNSADLAGIKKIVSLVNHNESILIFPEGTRSRTQSMIAAKRGIFLLAKLTKVKIVPIGIYGTEKLLPVNQTGDMSNEIFNLADVYVNIGSPFDMPKNIGKLCKEDYEAQTIDFMMRKISQLIPIDYRGIYK